MEEEFREAMLEVNEAKEEVAMARARLAAAYRRLGEFVRDLEKTDPPDFIPGVPDPALWER